jgi:hypothetical protein
MKSNLNTRYRMSKREVSGAQMLVRKHEVLIARVSEGCLIFHHLKSERMQGRAAATKFSRPNPCPLAIGVPSHLGASRGVRPLKSLFAGEASLSVHDIVTSYVDSRAARAATNSGRRYWHPTCFDGFLGREAIQYDAATYHFRSKSGTSRSRTGQMALRASRFRASSRASSKNRTKPARSNWRKCSASLDRTGICLSSAIDLISADLIQR